MFAEINTGKDRFAAFENRNRIDLIFKKKRLIWKKIFFCPALLGANISGFHLKSVFKLCISQVFSQQLWTSSVNWPEETPRTTFPWHPCSSNSWPPPPTTGFSSRSLSWWEMCWVGKGSDSPLLSVCLMTFPCFSLVLSLLWSLVWERSWLSP